MTTFPPSTSSVSLDLSDSEKPHHLAQPFTSASRPRASSFGFIDEKRNGGRDTLSQGSISGVSISLDSRPPSRAGSARGVDRDPDSRPPSRPTSRPPSRQSVISNGGWGLEPPIAMPDTEAGMYAHAHLSGSQTHLHGASPRFISHATRRSSELSILDNPYGASEGESQAHGSPGPLAGLLPSIQAQMKGLRDEVAKHGGKEEVLVDDDPSSSSGSRPARYQASGEAHSANGNGHSYGHHLRTPPIGFDSPNPSSDAFGLSPRPDSSHSHRSHLSQNSRDPHPLPAYGLSQSTGGTTLYGTPIINQDQSDEGEGSPAADGKKEPSIKPVPSLTGSRNVSGASEGGGLGMGNGYLGAVGQTAVDPSRTHAQHRGRPYVQPGTPGFSLGPGGGKGLGTYVYAPNGFPLSSPAMTPVSEKSALMAMSEGGGRSVSAGSAGGVTSPGGAQGQASFWDSPAWWLFMYFCFNLGLTLFNKMVLVSFPFPYTLTGLHALSGCAGCYVALEQGAFTPARLTSKENLILAAFSVLYTINIAVSNISLNLVTVPFHQVVRASTPLFTIMIATLVLRQKFSMMKLVSLLPVVAGVGFATYGDYYFTAWGLILTLLGTFLAALKTVVTNLIQTGGGGRLKLHPLDLLMRMSPLAFIQCVLYGLYTGELERVRQYGATQMTQGKAIALLINGVIACGLNIVSFTANKKAGALTMTVSANCKQVLTIALAVVLFDLHINILNGIGIGLTLIGGGWYGWVEFSERSKKARKPTT